MPEDIFRGPWRSVLAYGSDTFKCVTCKAMASQESWSLSYMMHKVSFRFLLCISVGMHLITKNSLPLDSSSCQYILQWHMCIDNHYVIDKLLNWFIGLTLFSVLYTGKLSQKIKYSSSIKKLIFSVKKPLSICLLFKFSHKRQKVAWIFQKAHHSSFTISQLLGSLPYKNAVCFPKLGHIMILI